MITLTDVYTEQNQGGIFLRRADGSLRMREEQKGSRGTNKCEETIWGGISDNYDSQFNLKRESSPMKGNSLFYGRYFQFIWDKETCF